jgi:hypothetical protein
MASNTFSDEEQAEFWDENPNIVLGISPLYL